MDKISEIWLQAADDLSIEIIAPFSFVNNGKKFEALAFVPHFGSENGTIIFSISKGSAEAQRIHYNYSELSPESY